MPVPTWDCPELALLYDQPVDVATTTVVSEDIWKKFDLDFPQPLSLDSTGYRYYGGIEDGIIPDPYDRSTAFGIYEKLGSSPLLSSSSTSRIEAREIRHHDCMWAGLCISKEHNRTHPAKKKEVHNQMSKKTAVPAGRSLLINRKQPASCNAGAAAAMPGLAKNLESDGDSTRPETPQSCESESDEEEDEDDEDEEEEEGEEETPRFKHDSISINEKLSEYVQAHGAGEINPSAAVPVSEVTGQLLPRKMGRVGIRAGGQQFNDHAKQQYTRKEEKAKANKAHFYPNNGNGNGNGNNRQDFNRTTNTVYAQGNNNCTNIVSLGDHCYHLNQTSSSKKLEHLGVQTPSDSEEEIDVVTFDKPSCRPASLPTNPSLADKHHLQKTVTSALKDKAPPRPRGRPPSTSTPRKRSAQSETAAKRPAKKPKQKTTMSYQKRSNNRTNNNNNNQNNNNNNNNSSNNNVDRDANCCNSRVSIDTDCSDINDELSGAETTRENNFANDRRRGGENNGASTTTTTRVSSNAGKDSSKLSSNGAATSTCSRSTSSDEEPDTEKRSLHNNMERQRRIELRKAFEDLRVLVPEVEMKEKAPKVVILRQAAIYCDLLTEIGQTTMATVEELKSRQDKLRSKLSQLRRNFRTERTGAEVRNSNHHNRRGRRGSGLQG